MRLAATHFSTINTAYDLHNIILYSWNFSDFIDSGSNTLIKGATEVQHPGFEPATFSEVPISQLHTEMLKWKSGKHSFHFPDQISVFALHWASP